MGVMNHNVVAATTWDAKRFADAWAWVEALPDKSRRLFLADAAPGINGYRSIVLLPDGSKEGWTESDQGDVLRATFMERLRMDDHCDGSSPWDFVEVSFGEFGAAVTVTNCKTRY